MQNDGLSHQERLQRRHEPLMVCTALKNPDMRIQVAPLHLQQIRVLRVQRPHQPMREVTGRSIEQAGNTRESLLEGCAGGRGDGEEHQFGHYHAGTDTV